MSDRAEQSRGQANVIFLVGAGRSGTTLLYKLLCLHPEIAYISNYDIRLPWMPGGWAIRLSRNSTRLKLRAWFDKGNAYFVQRPWVKRLVPTPVEGELLYSNCGLPLTPSAGYAPDADTTEALRQHFEGFRRAAGAKVLLSKRTANNRRIPTLNTIFPRAKYIHLIRDGRDVAHSLSCVEWWDDHVLWWDGRRAKDAENAGQERLSLCARNWVNEMTELEAGLEGVAQSQVHELRYEDLLDSAEEHLIEILRFIGLSATPEYLAAIRSLRLARRTSQWPSKWASDQLARVLQVEQTTLRRLGYIE